MVSQLGNAPPVRYDNLVELRHRVLAAPNDAGERIASWPTAYAQVWASKQDLRGQKRLLAQQVTSEQMTEFILRWRDDVHVTDRLVNLDANESYMILQVAEIGRNQGLDLLCQRIATTDPTT